MYHTAEFKPNGLTTTLKTAAKRGDTKLEVITMQGFRVGDRIRIGNDIYEESTIKAFGSLVLDQPLRMDHPEGAMITVVGGRPPVPVINLSVDDDEDDDADEHESQDGAASAAASRTAPCALWMW